MTHRLTLGVALLVAASALALAPPGASAAAKKTKCKEFQTSTGAKVTYAVKNYTCSAAKRKLNTWVKNASYCSGGWKIGRLRCTKGKSVIYYEIGFGGIDRALARSASATQSCRGKPINFSSGLAVWAFVKQAKKVGCAGARAVVAKYGDEPRFTRRKKGDTFRLGAYRCTMTKIYYETADARCVDGGRAFVVNWGV